MVRIIPSSVFIKDPVDVWNKEQTIGLAEHAVRVHAPAIPFDRRGEIILWDDYESPTQKYVSILGAGTINRSNDTSKFGDFSTKIVTGSTLHDNSAIYYYTSDYRDSKIGAQISFASADSTYSIWIVIRHYDGTNLRDYALEYEKSSGELSVFSDGTKYTLSPAVEYKASINNWGTLKFVIDIVNNENVRALFFRKEFDLSSHPEPKSISSMPTEEPRLYIKFYYQAEEAAAKTGYLDNFILTENEPA
ncbi:MAG: hypothetical protein OCU18_08540 [Candidatus Syntrophoarchaeum sp.]|nr:hypothetical protein [Candidatus Syntrophoarchaeum sp.]